MEKKHHSTLEMDTFKIMLLIWSPAQCTTIAFVSNFLLKRLPERKPK